MPPTSANGPSERPARQQLLLDAPADLQLLAQALLLEEALLVPAQVAGQEVERLREVPELAAVGHRDAHVEVAGGEPPRPLGERGDVPGHAVRQRQDAEERERGRARGRARGCSPRCAASPAGPGPPAGPPRSRSPSPGRAAPPPPTPPRRGASPACPGTCPSPASTASSAGSGAYTLPSGSRANGMAPCRRSAPERIARSSSRSSSPSAAASASRRAFWYGLSCPASGRPLIRVRRAFSSLGHDVHARRHLRGEVAGLGGHRLAEGPLRAEPGVERHPEEREDREEEEGDRELGPQPHRRHSPSTWTATCRRCEPDRCSQT